MYHHRILCACLFAALPFLQFTNCASNSNPSGPQGPTVTDVDGNVYRTVTIGTQVWMAENLKTTKLNDGTPIPLVTSDVEWGFPLTPAYCWYDNDSTVNKATYGGLYNWYAANTGRLAPTGWHVPSDSEWTVLVEYLGGDTMVAGGKLKEAGTTHLRSPHFGATDEVGFTALPGAERIYNGLFWYLGECGIWWSATACDSASAWWRCVAYDSAYVQRGHTSFRSAFSVRCVKNQ
jgi:uncharacterized protein (TIGR02145 family)